MAPLDIHPITSSRPRIEAPSNFDIEHQVAGPGKSGKKPYLSDFEKRTLPETSREETIRLIRAQASISSPGKMKSAIYFVHDCQGRPLSRRRIFWCHWRVSLKLLVLRAAAHVAKWIVVTLLIEETCFRMQVELKAKMNLYVKVSA